MAEAVARCLGDDGNPVALLGPYKAVYIIDTPVEALSFKAMHQEFWQSYAY